MKRFDSLGRNCCYGLCRCPTRTDPGSRQPRVQAFAEILDEGDAAIANAGAFRVKHSSPPAKRDVQRGAAEQLRRYAWFRLRRRIIHRQSEAGKLGFNRTKGEGSALCRQRTARVLRQGRKPPQRESCLLFDGTSEVHEKSELGEDD